jgi:hypothetical protein
MQSLHWQHGAGLMSLFEDIGLPGIFSDVMGDLVFYDAEIIRTAPGTGPAWSPGDGKTTTYPCKALVTSWSNYSMSTGLVAAKDRKILILADTLAVPPLEGDDILIKDREGATYRLASADGSAPAVKRDPSTSVWTCRGRA